MAFQADIRRIDNAVEPAKIKENRTNDRTFDGTFSRDKYDASELVYPADLLGNDSRYGGNYMVIFINVNEASRAQDAYGNDLASSDYVPDFDKRVTTSIQENNYDALAAAAGLGGQNLIAGISGGAIGNLLRGGGSALGSAVRGGIAGAVGAAASTGLTMGALYASGVKFQPQKKRLKRCIMLHMPNQIRTDYGMIYGESSLKNFAIGAAIGQDVADIVKSAGSDLLAGKEINTAGFIDKLKSNKGALGSVALSMPNNDGIQAMTGMQANPKAEVMFNGVQFRQFQFAYQFFPRNQSEQEKIEDIIRELKYHQHPDYLDDKKFVYVYPSEFDISFYHDDEENSHLPKLASCALVAVSVDYTPNGMWAANADGSPTQINIQLHFKELATLSKEAIQKGY